ncbi:hypothetical protein F5B18DRAFT_577767 [Nemania serpens]|nr:hypothetical protein F5B18DRAFT_577767 [Nemania serpens]
MYSKFSLIFLYAACSAASPHQLITPTNPSKLLLFGSILQNIREVPRRSFHQLMSSAGTSVADFANPAPPRKSSLDLRISDTPCPKTAANALPTYARRDQLPGNKVAGG